MKLLKATLLVLVCAALLTTIFLNSPGNAVPVAANEQQQSQNKISVTGSADVMVMPDEAVITVGIESRNRSMVKAKEENDEISKKIKDITEDFKIEAKCVQLDYMDIKPCDLTKRGSYDYYYDTAPENMGYVVRKKVVITLKNLDNFEKVITEIAKNGAELIQGVEFKTTELRKNKDKARELAVQAAKEKASAMTKVLGQQIGKAVTITEQEEYSWSWYDSWYSGLYGSSSMAANSVQNVISSGNQQQNSQDIAPGSIKVRAKVSIDFALL